MKKFLSIVFTSLMLLLGAPAQAASASFSVDNSTAYDHNPERGWYFHLQPGEFCNSVGTSVRDGADYSQPTNLMYLDFYLGGSVSSLQTSLDCARSIGVKVIVSPIYCTSLGCNEGVTISQLETDVAALKTTLYANKDVVVALRMGGIGGWGEWASWAGVVPIPATVRSRAFAAFLAAAHPETPVLFTEPPYLQIVYPTVLTLKQALTGLAGQSQIGFYNDGFMGGADDRFHYPGPEDSSVELPPWTTSSASQRAYAAQLTEHAMSIVEPETGSPSRSACSGGTDNVGQSGGIVNEGPRYHLVSIHRGYNNVYHDAWISGGCYASVNNLMGYRIQYNSISHADTVSRSSSVTFTITAQNNGWARNISRRAIQVRLVRSGANRDVTCLTQQLRTLKPLGPSTTLAATCAIQSDQTTGSYTVYLEMPDAHSSISGTVAFKAQSANANNGGQTWDSTNRRFATGTTITIN